MERQRALLLPVRAGRGPETDAEIEALIGQYGLSALDATLARHGMDGIWYEFLTDRDDLSSDCFALREKLLGRKAAALLERARHREMAESIHATLMSLGIPYLIFKGLHLGDALYRDSSNRLGVDLDVLVAPADRDAAIKALIGLGLNPQPKPRTVSHECAFRNDQLEVDLHWHLIRPGRTRIALTDLLLAGRVQTCSYVHPDDVGTLLILLTHPLLTTRPFADDFKLVRFADLGLWISNRHGGWEEVLPVLSNGRLRHVAWVMLEMLRRLTGWEAPSRFADEFAPRGLKRMRLTRWINEAAPPRLLQSQTLGAIGFGLSLFETIPDAYTAVIGALRARHHGAQDAISILHLSRSLPTT